MLYEVITGHRHVAQPPVVADAADGRALGALQELGLLSYNFV